MRRVVRPRFFVFGFEKNERANASTKELVASQAAAADLLQPTVAQLDAHAASAAIEEIRQGDQVDD